MVEAEEVEKRLEAWVGVDPEWVLGEIDVCGGAGAILGAPTRPVPLGRENLRSVL